MAAPEEEVKVTILLRAAVRVLVEPALRLIQNDPHQWSTRPCGTCHAVTSIVGTPFGCSLYAQQQQEKTGGRA